MNKKHLRWGAVKKYLPTLIKRLAHGQTNYFKTLWMFHKAYDCALLLADHAKPVDYCIPLPPPKQHNVSPESLYIHASRGRHGRQIDNETERFVDTSRVGIPH